MLGIVGEKDVEKLLRGLVRIQAAFDIMRGSVELIQAGARAWRAYREAVTAAAVAQTAMNATSMAGGVGAAGRTAGGAGAAAGVGAAGMGLKGGLRATGGLALSLIPKAGPAALVIGTAVGSYYAGRLAAKQLGWIPKPLPPITPIAKRQAATERGIAFANREISQRTAMEANRREWYGSTIQSQMFGREESPQARLRANQLEMAELRRRSGQTIGWNEQRAKSLGTAAAVHFEATGKYDEVTQRLGAMRAQHLLAADLERVGMLKEMKRLTEERGRDEIEAARKAGRFALESLLIARKQVETAKEKAKVAREEYSSAKQRFGLLDSREQRKHVALKAKLDRGEDLSRAEVSYLWESGDKETQAALGRRAEQIAEASGWSDRYYSPAESATAQAKLVAAQKGQRTEAESLGYSSLVSATDERTITHRIEVDVTAKEGEISQKVGRVLEDINRDIYRGAESASRRAASSEIEKDRLNQASQEAAGRGG